jgi:hypothetical protein
MAPAWLLGSHALPHKSQLAIGSIIGGGLVPAMANGQMSLFKDIVW